VAAAGGELSRNQKRTRARAKNAEDNEGVVRE
jgi:hypothetical protein